MFDRRSILIWGLRLLGASTLLAIPFILLPTDWLAEIHAWLGLGEYPRAPVVDYMARSLSALYAMIGGLLLLLSTDIDRYRPGVAYLAWAAILFGIVVLGIDIHAGLPFWWTAHEGPMSAALGLLILWLLKGVPQPPKRLSTSGGTSFVGT